MPTSNVVDWLSKTLALGSVGRRWPKDEEFRDGLLRYRAYAQPDRCKFLLETLEAHHGHKERTDADSATIEHVMPRTLSPEWRTMLGPGADEIHERWLDVLGNLTLTGYNSELSNSAFSKKRQLLATSHFELNRWICSRERWTQAEIQERSAALSDRATEVWSRPAD